jgi:hypothetical protein
MGGGGEYGGVYPDELRLSELAATRRTAPTTKSVPQPQPVFFFSRSRSPTTSYSFPISNPVIEKQAA